MNPIPLVNRLVAQSVGVVGKSLFLSMMPTECQLGVLLRPPLTGTKIDYELPGYYKTTIQIISRSHDYLEGLELMNKAVSALTIHTDTQLDGMLVRYLRPRHKPVSFPVSEGNFIEFSVSMEICFNEDV